MGLGSCDWQGLSPEVVTCASVRYFISWQTAGVPATRDSKRGKGVTGSLQPHLLQTSTGTKKASRFSRSSAPSDAVALSPRTSASPKRHGVELGHHHCASGSRAVHPRARPPCSSTVHGLRKECARPQNTPAQTPLAQATFKGRAALGALVGM